MTYFLKMIRNDIFFENIFPRKDKENIVSNSEKRIENETTSSKSMDEEPKSLKRTRPDPNDTILRRGSRVRTPKSFGHDYNAFMLDEEPMSIKVASASPNRPH